MLNMQGLLLCLKLSHVAVSLDATGLVTKLPIWKKAKTEHVTWKGYAK